MDIENVAHVVSELMDGVAVRRMDKMQALWSGYGAIYRVTLASDAAGSDTAGADTAGADTEPSEIPRTVVVKSVAPPTRSSHPRGWNSDLSHQRKLQSYAVERTFYRDFAPRCDALCRVPYLLAERSEGHRWLFVFEDLDAAGFSARRGDASDAEIRACLSWLASFHATFLGASAETLWPVGTYWHLATRPEELAATADARLRKAAPAIDARLNACRFQTLVHGDAKIANFCFPPQGGAVAAVDFQYVGGGCGMKDVAYFLSSCLSSRELETQAERYVDAYFGALRRACAKRLPEETLDALEAEWRHLYAFAWADFYRFLAGWSPQHWKIDTYSRRVTEEVLRSL